VYCLAASTSAAFICFQNNEIIRNLARMLIRFVSASLSSQRVDCEPLSLVIVQFCLSTQEAQDMATGEDPL